MTVEVEKANIIEVILSLSKVEFKILQDISAGYNTTKALAKRNNCTESTIRDHLSKLKKKGLIFDTCLLSSPRVKLYYINILR
ncbi:MAG: helix-turn-helix transcriptional regulator [Candidatus Heimdallarchaeaceae archaeon]